MELYRRTSLVLCSSKDALAVTAVNQDAINASSLLYISRHLTPSPWRLKSVLMKCDEITRRKKLSPMTTQITIARGKLRANQSIVIIFHAVPMAFSGKGAATFDPARPNALADGKLGVLHELLIGKLRHHANLFRARL